MTVHNRGTQWRLRDVTPLTEEEELLGFQIDEALGAVILNNEQPGKNEPFLLDPAFFENDGE